MLKSEPDNPVREDDPSPRRGLPGRHSRRLPRRRVLLGGTAVLAIGAAGAVYALQGDGGAPAQSDSALPTAKVVRTDMAQTAKVDGTLGFANAYTVLAGAGGRITWLPAVGAVVERGEAVYGADGEKVPLLYGTTPFWRELQQGMSKGRDVKVLEANLHALGYGDGAMTVDTEFTWATSQAVRKWQHDLRLTQTGTVKPGDVVVQPGALRVAKVQAILGGPAAGTVLTASGNDRVVTVKLPVSQQTLAKKGGAVRVTLPGDKTVTARVSSVGTVATAGTNSSGSQTGTGTENATVPVTITLDEPGSAGRLDGAPVTVGFTSAAHENVLAVPVNALLASAGGAYSVNVVESGGTVRSVPVKLGIFDGDRVEVSGNLTPGMSVQVPRS
ncbi:efflux RND transporter periplasmic adaptor subunit [Actinomadura soli]|uniref:Efflux RND transporter periplasmic adaptor subunit n=1 Tax=Actinomadura soli TaxID=2508997 RepID=A0A5C4JKG9_9ACTN|nr:efflux RND transporter periplasmic adaptor subunit [Actinomadura soli]TMR07231.1 efflux RND transporter periplasmic adaptor subunit [Actinomadura soli]